MLLKTLQSTITNLRGVCRVIKCEAVSTTQLQKYSKWASRKPAAIINEDELFDIEENTTPIPETKTTRSRSRKLKSEKIQQENVKSQNLFENENNEITKNFKNTLSTKLYENEKILSSIMMSLRSKKQRQKNDEILCEGVRLIEDAIDAGIQPECIIFSRWEDIKHIEFKKKGIKLYKVPYRSIQLWSTLTTSPGVMGIFKKPKPKEVSKFSLPITIICDNIRDPGNMGSILRAAAGIGCEKVILTKGCVDFWDTKVLRSATGAHFRLPIFGSQEWSDIKTSLSNDAHIYLADNKMNLNNQECNKTESVDENLEEKEEQEIEVLNSKSRKKNIKRKQNFIAEKLNNLSLIPYYAVDYTKNEVILIIGGETEGLSMESFDLLRERQGIRVNIPLDNNIDSLNAGMALGIIGFEIKRQFLQCKIRLNQL